LGFFRNKNIKTMAGINRALKSTRIFSESRKNIGIKCVFLSHQQADKEVCKKIADYLIAADIDVYFDEYDEDLKISRQSNKPKEVVDCIKKGINNSSHMLVVVSLNTLQSKWVPFEIGYGYDKTELGVICLKGIPLGKLPEYIRTAPQIVRDIYDLNELIKKISGKEEKILIEARMMSDFKNVMNPLSNIMDSLIQDTY
jgi:hypothetical protein